MEKAYVINEVAASHAEEGWERTLTSEGAFRSFDEALSRANELAVEMLEVFRKNHRLDERYEPFLSQNSHGDGWVVANDIEEEDRFEYRVVETNLH